MERHRGSEYVILRRTIAHRGALRPILVLTGIGLWAAALIAVLALIPYPVASAIPLLVLVVTFEVIRPLHFGAERIGRYVQVFYEEEGDPGRALSDTPSWERVAMRFGTVPGVGGHPLFVPLFFLAVVVDLFLFGTMTAPATVETAFVAGAHGAFIAWLFITDRAMRKQRAIELERLRSMKNP